MLRSLEYGEDALVSVPEIVFTGDFLSVDDLVADILEGDFDGGRLTAALYL